VLSFHGGAPVIGKPKLLAQIFDRLNDRFLGHFLGDGFGYRILVQLTY
jgi:hypothetical protein